MAKPIKPAMRSFILTLKNGNTRKIEIPADWKMTYGSIVPFNGQRGGDHHGVALRLYEGNKENLRAVMADVVAIRDASISILEKRTSVQRKAAQKQTPKGMKDVVVEARMTEWVDPDAEDEDETPNEFLALPGSSDDEPF
jgi:hypothetical protein